jgi:putative redox protein
MSEKITATITETDASLFSVDVDVNGHQFIGDEPESFGSKNLGPAPYDLLLAALGECTAMTIRWVAEQKGWPLEKVRVELTHEKQNKQDVFTKKIMLEGDKLTQEQRDSLQDAAAKCPVNKTLNSEVRIETISDS